MFWLIIVNRQNCLEITAELLLIVLIVDLDLLPESIL